MCSLRTFSCLFLREMKLTETFFFSITCAFPSSSNCGGWSQPNNSIAGVHAHIIRNTCGIVPFIILRGEGRSRAWLKYPGIARLLVFMVGLI